MSDALVVVVDVEAREVIEKEATDVVTLVRVRRVVLLESLRLLSAAGLAEVVAILRLLLRTGELFRSFVVEYDNISSSMAEWQH